MPNPAVAWIPLGIEPFGRVAHPAHGEGSHRHAMADDDHMAHVVSPVVVDDGAKHVFTPDRNVETAFSHWGCGISAPVVENMLVVVLAGVKMWFHKLGIVKAIEDSGLLIDRRLCRQTLGEKRTGQFGLLDSRLS